jgi:hypothetical protein
VPSSAALDALGKLAAELAAEPTHGWIQENRHAAQESILAKAIERVRAAEADSVSLVWATLNPFDLNARNPRAAERPHAAVCGDCGGAGAHITNALWPSGTEPHRAPCGTCGGSGHVEEGVNA